MPPPIIDLPDRAAWRAWLAANHNSSGSIRLVVSKKGQAGVSYTDAVEEALCYGWIDSRTNKLDGAHYLLLISPRRKGSIWSKQNKERIVRLEALGLMTAPGLAKITAAIEDGSWNALDEVEALHLPPALAEAFAANPNAQVHWDASSESLRKQWLYWLASARLKETIRHRVEQLVALAETDRLRELSTPKPELPDDR
jgi:uncharacterized protein YdeI (YjbR/CyaY-like superfamily)